MKDRKDPTAHDEANEATRSTNERRALLGSSVTSAASALLGVLAAACGDDSDSNGTGGGSASSTGATNTTATGPGPTSAQSTSGTPASSSGNGGNGGAGSTGQGGDGGSGGGGPDNDIDPLNALLRAEYLAIAAYGAGAGIIDAATEEDPLFALKDVIISVATSFLGDHTLHAEALVDAIVELDGTPLDQETVAATFEPPPELVANPTILNVLKFAASAERSAAVAYNQTIFGLEDAKYRFLAGAISGDETQHFIVLAALVTGLAAPGPNLDTASGPDVVPEPFVATVGEVTGLDVAPPDYFP